MTPKAFTPYLIPALLLTALAVLTILQLLMAATPPVSIDALIHHLAVPKLYLQEGRIYEITHLSFGYFPMNVDFLYLVCLYLGNDIAPKILHCLFGFITAGVIYDYLRTKLTPTYGLLGALLFLSLPIVVRMSGTAYVDLGFVCFCTLSMRSLMSWKWSACKRTRHLALSGIWCGLALGTKYNGLVFLFVTAVLIPPILLGQHRDLKRRQIKALAAATLWVTVARSVFSPWMVRNLLWTGNPIYPLYRQQIAAITPDLIKPAAKQKTSTALDYKPAANLTGHFASRYVGFNEPLWKIMLIPLRIFFQGTDHNPQFFDGRLNPYLLLLPLLLLLKRYRPTQGAKNDELGFWTGMAVLTILLTFVQTDMRIRYILPAIPPLVILAVYGTQHVIRLLQPRLPKTVGTILLVSVLGILLMPNMAYLTKRFATINPWSYLTGQEMRHDFIQRFRREHAVYRFMNHNTPADSLVLGMYVGRRGYYANRDIRFNTDFFWNQVRQTPDAAGMRDGLKKAGITHLVVRHDLFKKLARLNHQQHISKINHFFSDYCRMLFAKNGYGLYQLTSVD